MDTESQHRNRKDERQHQRQRPFLGFRRIALVFLDDAGDSEDGQRQEEPSEDLQDQRMHYPESILERRSESSCHRIGLPTSPFFAHRATCQTGALLAFWIVVLFDGLHCAVRMAQLLRAQVKQDHEPPFAGLDSLRKKYDKLPTYPRRY